jgi:hypothetical protein
MTRKPAAPTATASDTTALATVASTTGVTRDVLDGLDLGDADDGLGELGREELTVGTLALNAKRTDANGRQIGADMLFNTVDETARESDNATLLCRDKTRSYTRYDETEQRTHVLCRSEDLITGTMADGHTRKCERCPDAEWTTDKETGKRGTNCAVTHSVLALDRDQQQLFIIRFRKTSEPLWRAHLKKHHIGRRVQHGKISNYPLYTYAVRLSGKMASAKATYALPVIEPVGVLPPEEIKMCAETVAAYRDQMRGWVARAEAADVDAHASDADDSAGGDTSFATDKFVDAPGGAADFVE